MPTYEFRCNQCQRVFDVHYSSVSAAQRAPVPACPSCGSELTQRIPSRFALGGGAATRTGGAGTGEPQFGAQSGGNASITPREQIDRWRKS